MGWLPLVGSLKLQVSFAKESYKRDYILLYIYACTHVYTFTSLCCKSCAIIRPFQPTYSHVNTCILCAKQIILKITASCSLRVRALYSVPKILFREYKALLLKGGIFCRREKKKKIRRKKICLGSIRLFFLKQFFVAEYKGFMQGSSHTIFWHTESGFLAGLFALLK